MVIGLQTAESLEKDRVCTIMADVYHIAKQDQSLHSIAARLKVTEYQLQRSLGRSYRNNDMAREFVECLADVVRQDLVAEIRESPWYALTVDESYDKGWKAQICFGIRFLNKVRTKDVF